MKPAPPVTSTRSPCQSFCFSEADIFLSVLGTYYTVTAVLRDDVSLGQHCEIGGRARTLANIAAAQGHRTARASDGPADHNGFSRPAVAPDRRAQGCVDFPFRSRPRNSSGSVARFHRGGELRAIHAEFRAG